MKVALPILAVALLMIGCRPKAQVDSSVTAATTEARASITNFISVLQSPGSNQALFRVLASFPTDAPLRKEALWVNVWKYDNGVFAGTISEGNPDIDSTGLTNGQPVAVAASNVWDWSYVDRRKGTIGNFIMRTQR
jgi:uncharacterized protein YegJ (DUF2314 family)